MAYMCIPSMNNMMLILFWFYRILAIKGIMADFMDKTYIVELVYSHGPIFKEYYEEGIFCSMTCIYTKEIY